MQGELWHRLKCVVMSWQTYLVMRKKCCRVIRLTCLSDLLSNGDQAEMRSVESWEDDDADDNGVAEEDISDVDTQQPIDGLTAQQARMFQLSFVNIYGNAEVNKLCDDGKPIKFGRK